MLRDVDLAIRTARPTQGDMLVRKLGDLAFGLYAHQDRAASFNDGVEITSPEKLADEPLIGFDEDAMPTGPVWFLSRVEKSMKLVTRAAGDRARLQMVKENMGFSALPCIMADAEPELQKVAGPEMVGSLELWLLRGVIWLSFLMSVRSWILSFHGFGLCDRYFLGIRVHKKLGSK